MLYHMLAPFVHTPKCLASRVFWQWFEDTSSLEVLGYSGHLGGRKSVTTL